MTNNFKKSINKLQSTSKSQKQFPIYLSLITPEMVVLKVLILFFVSRMMSFIKAHFILYFVVYNRTCNYYTLY